MCIIKDREREKRRNVDNSKIDNSIELKVFKLNSFMRYCNRLCSSLYF